MNSPSRNSACLSKSALEEAWISLLGLYGRAFEAQYGSIDGEQFHLWFAGLCSNGITDQMVVAATSAISTDHAHRTIHPPNFADFLRLCSSSRSSNLVPEDEAFAEATSAARGWDRHVWSSAAVYRAALAIGAWSLRHYPEKVTRSTFFDAYRNLLERQLGGEVLEPPPAPSRAPSAVQRLDSESVSATKGRRDRMAALSKALLELPEHLQLVATDAIKNGRFVDPDVILPEGLLISAVSRVMLLKYCCNVVMDSQPQTEEPTFSPPSL